MWSEVGSAKLSFGGALSEGKVSIFELVSDGSIRELVQSFSFSMCRIRRSILRRMVPLSSESDKALMSYMLFVSFSSIFAATGLSLSPLRRRWDQTRRRVGDKPWTRLVRNFYSRGDVSHSVSSSYELMMEVGPVTSTESESFILSLVSVYICY